ncbi:MAG: hypothetical protein MUF72_20225 [Elainella sp. Prado103]|jgi:hypothetical protein|nr:hypothetical protein [Elainella sp. Prado103]
MNQAAERIESLKAGIASAAGAAIVWSGLQLGAIWAIFPELDGQVWQRALWSPETGLQLGIAIFSGFLFGVTYRYIVRSDRNTHLRSGAAGAFGLVRGLAEIDRSLLQAPIWASALVLLENLLLFGLLSLWLDWLLQKGWLQEFGANLED